MKKTVAEMSAAELADAHFGHTMAKMRTKKALEEIEAELDSRNISAADGERAFVSRQIGDIGLVNIKRLRADLGDDIWREYAIPGSHLFWRSKSHAAIAAERAASSSETCSSETCS